MVEGCEVAVAPLPAPDLAAFTYPRWRRWLADDDAASRADWLLPVAARINGVPVGLALVSLGTKAEAPARLMSVMVAPFFRRRGIGRALVEAAARLARDRGAERLVAYHNSRAKGRDGWERLLARCGWDAPRLHEMRLGGRADWTEAADGPWRPFLERVVAQGYATSLWAEMDAADRADITGLIDELALGRRFDPFPWEQHVDPDLSLVIRRRGRPVGWIVADRTSADHHLYAIGWVRPELAVRGWLIAGMIDACRRQAALHGPDSVAVYCTSGDNAAMQSVMRRRLLPLGPLWHDEIYESGLPLCQSQENEE